MKIALVTHGTRGDAQPFAALGLALIARGHEVKLAVPPNLIAFVRKCGIEAGKIGIDSQAFMESEEGRKWLASGNVSAFMKRMSAIAHAHLDEIIDDYSRVFASADLIVAGILTEDAAAVFAERRGIPLVALHLAPLRATSAFPNCLALNSTAKFFPKSR
jgi:UDP:flavonoid glycosyltransferase YjiC (YdhE family)